jgi:hypothetical protein
VWTPDVLQILARADVRRGHDKVQEVRVSCHGETGVSVSEDFPHLRDNRAPPSTSSSTTTEPAVASIR